MKPLLTLVISGASLAIVAAAAPSIRGQFLNAAVPTAWAQQERGRGDKDRDRDKDRDDDRGGSNKGEDKADRDEDRADRDDDRGGSNKDDDKADRDDDRGGGNKDDDKADRDDDRGGSNKGDDKADRDDDRGGGNKDDDKADRDDDRGGSNKDDDKADRDDNRGADNKDEDRGGPNEDAGNPIADNDNPGGGTNDNRGANADVADRDAEPVERVRGDESDRDDRELAGGFDLDDTETFDDDGFLARRGEIIAMSTDTLLRRRATALGLEVVQQEFLASLNTTMYRLSVPAASPIDGILARLRAQDPEGVFDRNHLYDRSAATVASHTGSQSHALIDSAQGISVGLIDTGVDALHPALAGTHVELQYFVDESRVLPEEHGTAVVSLLVSPQFGVLPDAQLYVACVFYEDRRGGSLSEARDLVRALDWLMTRHVPVINMSLSGPPNEVLRAAIKRAVEAGHLIVAAVGNAGPASPPLYPAAYDGVIAVTAVDGGQHVYRRATRGAHIELAAMGVDVVAAGPAGPTTYSGTSFASPYVAALAAVEYRSLDPQKALAVKEGLRENALDLGKPGRDEIYGFGLARPRAIATVAR
jgi:subtilisin family serine protease